MSPLEFAILGLYFLTLVILAVFGVHRYIMVYLYFRHRDRRALPLALPRACCRGSPSSSRSTTRCTWWTGCSTPWRASATRRSCCEIQVLDDSTDETHAIAQGRGRALPRAGLRHPLPPPHRPRRLQGGRARRRPAGGQGRVHPHLRRRLRRPRRTSWRRRLGHFDDPRVGMVQVRWGHVNRDYSLLTQVQSVLLDGHFILEHGGRNRAGRFFNFNGTAGIWRRDGHRRRAAAGSTTPSPRTSTSPTARSCSGWRFVFVQDVVSPGGDPGGDERLQEPAAPLGQGLDPDLQEAAAADPGLATCPCPSRWRRPSTSPRTSPTR